MDFGTTAWVVARVAGLSCYAALALAVLTGVALRTGVLDWLGSNRALRSVHDFTTVLWVPLGLLHLVALVLDPTARVRVIDLVVPFLAPVGTLALGLGTIAAWLLAVGTIAAWVRARLPAMAWQALHRLSYLAFALVFVHALLAGTDFSDRAVSALTWGSAAGLGILVLARIAPLRLSHR